MSFKLNKWTYPLFMLILFVVPLHIGFTIYKNKQQKKETEELVDRKVKESVDQIILEFKSEK